MISECQRRMDRLVREKQDEICAALEKTDPTAQFREDRWSREGGGGGITRILQDGEAFEKAGVNTSHVFGALTEAFAKKLAGDGLTFSATGLSLVIHPKSPLVPTVHANFRFIVHGQKAWFGGGIDLTPWYLFDDDARHFHRTLKEHCDRHDPAYYPRFKKTCDEYFRLKHRGESRGIGGIFFEALEGSLIAQMELVEDCAAAFLPAYLPIVERRRGLPYGPKQRAWQELRRGRYVEFNLLFDRGTMFGLETGGRVESILMSLPPMVRWAYGAEPEAGSEEEKLVGVLKRPKDWC